MGSSIFIFVVPEDEGTTFETPRAIGPTKQCNILEELQLILQTEVKSGHLLSLDIAVQSREFTCDLRMGELLRILDCNCKSL